MQVWIDDLCGNVRDLEKMKSQREAIEDWIDKQNLLITDWITRPSKLRPESIKADLSAMKELLSHIGDKRSHILMDLSPFRK